MGASRIRIGPLAVMGFLSLQAALGGAPKGADEYGLAVGQKMPFHVADLVGDKTKKHRCWCPAAMIANSGGRGVIVWARGAADPAFRLAEALDAGVAEGDKLQRSLIVFDADKEVLREKAAGLRRVLVGKARDSAKDELDRCGVDAKVLVLVFMIDREDIKAAWSFAADELGDAQIKELVAAAKQFAAGGK